MSTVLTLPILENGDALTRSEFERRYQAMPHLKKAELIEGIVYMGSPLRFKPHAEPHANLMGWLWLYSVMTRGTAVGDNPTVRLDLSNEVQPDAVLLIEPEHRGQTQLSCDGYIEGAPELIVEIAASTASIDLRDKKEVYRRNGVQEYIVWQVMENRLSWFIQDPSISDRFAYFEQSPDQNGILRSHIFPGLWLQLPALLSGQMQTVMNTLQEGIQSSEHQAFIEKLQESQN